MGYDRGVRGTGTATTSPSSAPPRTASFVRLLASVSAARTATPSMGWWPWVYRGRRHRDSITRNCCCALAGWMVNPNVGAVLAVTRHRGGDQPHARLPGHPRLSIAQPPTVSSPQRRPPGAAGRKRADRRRVARPGEPRPAHPTATRPPEDRPAVRRFRRLFRGLGQPADRLGLARWSTTAGPPTWPKPTS